MGAPNRDAAVAASSFIVTHIVVATAQFLIVRAATKRRYRRCCPLLWRCGLLRSRRCAVVTMRSVFPGTAALVRAWNLQNAETRVVKPTENPLTLLITATLSPSRRARLTIFKSYWYRVISSFYGVGRQIRRQAGPGAVPSRATFL